MASATPSDPWMRELNDASKLADEVNDMIRQSSSLPSSRPQTQRHLSAARRKMTILRTKLETLGSLLPDLPNKMRISLKEMSRRKDMLNDLSLKAREMAPTLNMSMSPDRDSLFGLDKKQDDVMDIAQGLDNKGLVEFQQQIIKDQDEELDNLEAAITSTKHIALAVNEELDLHTRLLENLEANVDTTESRLQRVIKKVRVMNKEKNRGGCASLMLMVIAIVALVAITWSLLKYL